MSRTSASLNIVLVEDHDLLRTVTQSVLTDSGHKVLALSCAEEVDDAISSMSPDLYILDLNLPGEDGLSLAKRIRQSHPRVGIIMTTARTDVADRLDGYESGADIYLPKPTDPSELLAAVEALARRLGREQLDEVPLGNSVLLLSTQTMRLVGVRQQVLLTFSEVQVLCGLARAAGGVLERIQIASILEIDMDAKSTASLEMRVARLRRKLTQASGYDNPLRAVRGVGYKLCVAITVI
jgi:DNA-binding response OmpR family regulator